MIKFFRKIRHRILTESKFSKYILYASGEIVLVVIGILIALQINNWNEARKLAIQKVEILHEFQESLQNDLEKIEANMIINAQVKKSAKLILAHMNKGLPYQDTLKYYFGMTVSTWPVDIKVGVYQNYRSSNLGQISSNDLKRTISNIYETRYSNLKRFQYQYREMIEKASQDFLNKRFESFWTATMRPGKLIIISYQPTHTMLMML
jgi:pyruvate/2-oxoacid:ferredoxin oxidoreductase alpha subunit